MIFSLFIKFIKKIVSKYYQACINNAVNLSISP